MSFENTPNTEQQFIALLELYIEQVSNFIETKDWWQLKSLMASLHYAEIAEIIKKLESDYIFIAFRVLSHQKAAEVFSELDPDNQLYILNQMKNNSVRDIISELTPDDRTSLFEELPGEVAQRIINILPHNIRKESLELLGYPEDSIGRLMTPDFIAISKDWTTGQAIEHIRKHGHRAEIINIIFIVDQKWRLIDDIHIRKIILANPNTKIEDLMDNRFFSISAFENQEKAIGIISRHDLIALPVVDSDNILLGIVTFDDIMDVIGDETNEDFHKTASIIPMETQYTQTGFNTLYRKRITWLLFLAIAGFLSASVIGHFEDILTQVVALAFFIPILIGSGGNVGAQSATIMVRAITTEDIKPSKWFFVIKKELFVGILLGITLGIILFLIGSLTGNALKISFTVAISMIAVVFWANIIGSILPLILTKIKLDPAIVSNPLITTLVDVTGLIIYFTVAALILNL